MKIYHLFFLLFIMIMYGSSYPIGKIGISNFPPLLMGSLRCLFLFLCVLPFFRFSIPKKNFKHLILFSFSMGVCVYGFVYLAIDFSSLISPIIIGSQLTVPFGLILSWFFLGEFIQLKKWFLIFSSFFGIMIVAYDPKFGQEIIGLIFIIMMSFFYALSNVLSRFLKDIRIVDQIGWHSFIGFIFLLLLSFCLEGNFLNHIYPLNYSGMLVAFHAGFFVSLIGHGGLFYLYKFYPISIILPYYSLFPIFGIILTFLIFYEVPQIYEIIGGIVVIGSVYLMHKDNKNTKVLK